MISVHITTYPQGEAEEMFTVIMPAAPRVGDSIHLDIDSVPILDITSVCWVYSQHTRRWHVECSAR